MQVSIYYINAMKSAWSVYTPRKFEHIDGTLQLDRAVGSSIARVCTTN